MTDGTSLEFAGDEFECGSEDADLYVRDLGLLVHNMVPKSLREDVRPEVMYFGEWSNDFADYECDVELTIPPESKLQNSIWHEGKGYDMEWTDLIPRKTDDDGRVYTLQVLRITLRDRTQVRLNLCVYHQGESDE